MRDIFAGVTPNFGRKSSARGRKSKKAESSGFMSGALLRRKVTPKKIAGVSIDAPEQISKQNGVFARFILQLQSTNGKISTEDKSIRRLR